MLCMFLLNVYHSMTHLHLSSLLIDPKYYLHLNLLGHTSLSFVWFDSRLELEKSATPTCARRGSCVDNGSVSATVNGDHYLSRFSNTW